MSDRENRQEQSILSILFPNKKSVILVSCVAAVMVLITIFAIIFSGRNSKQDYYLTDVEVLKGLVGTSIDPKVKELAEKEMTPEEIWETYGQYDVEIVKQETPTVQKEETAKGGNIKVSKKDVTTDGFFYNYVSKNGVFMQLIFLKGPDGKIRVALNTSEECKGESDAYFERGLGIFKCKHCGRVVADAEVGMDINDGAPIKVSFKNGLTSISVSESELLKYEDYFTNWNGPKNSN